MRILNHLNQPKHRFPLTDSGSSFPGKLSKDPIMIQDRRLFTATLFSMPLISLLGGCGGGADTDVSKPVEVTAELGRQARAADDFFEKEKASGKEKSK